MVTFKWRWWIISDHTSVERCCLFASEWVDIADTDWYSQMASGILFFGKFGVEWCDVIVVEAEEYES